MMRYKLVKLFASFPLGAGAVQSDDWYVDRYAEDHKEEIETILSKVECSKEEASQALQTCNNDVTAAVVKLKEQLPPEVTLFTKL